MKLRSAPTGGQSPVMENLESRTLLTVGLLVTEFMANNTKTLKDSFGAYSDWIEINNPTGAPVNLDGWFLTDSASNLQKWKFPDVMLPNGGYLIVFASNRNIAVAGQELHTNFSLSASGEYLGLVEPDGHTIDSSYNFPGQYPDVSYGLGTVSSPVNLVTVGMQSAAFVPSDDTLQNSFGDPALDDSAWQHGPTGVGYDPSGNYNSLIGNDIGALMYGNNSTAYVRVPFTLADAGNFTGLTLSMKYDDGFVAYLNGSAVASQNDPVVTDWNSAATANSEAGGSYTTYDLSADAGSLQNGLNVLAFQALTTSPTANNSLILPQLSGTQMHYQNDPGLIRFFQNPTPGKLNVAGTNDLGPIVSNVTNTMAQPSDAADIVIQASVMRSVNAVSNVKLYYRVMYNTEVSLTMYDDGAHGDGAAGDGVYAATIPASASSVGQMVRWYVIATDSASKTSRLPLYTSATNSAQYYGTVVNDPSYAATQLPVFHYFFQTPSGADTTTGTRGSVYFLGELYDNIFVRKRGSTINGQVSSNFARKIDFTDDHQFLVRPGMYRANQINLNLTGPEDYSYLRNYMSYHAYDLAGAAGPESDIWHVRQNGAAVGVRLYFEQNNSDMLKREGLDKDAELYKCGGTTLTSVGGAEKKNPNDTLNDYSSLQSLINGISPSNPNRHQWVMDNLDLPALVNYLAVDAIISDSDIIQTNYDVYRGDDGLWRFIPYDRDLTWGSYVGGNPTYYMSIYYGDSDHPHKARGWNVLRDAIFQDPDARDMFRTRLRTLMDEFLGAPGTDPSTWVYDNLATAEYNKMQWEATHGMIPNIGGETLAQGVYSTDSNYHSLLNWYVANRRNQLFNGLWDMQKLPDAQPAPFYNQVTFGSADYNPGIPGQAYIQICNNNDYGMDVSGWRIAGGVDWTFPNGTVILPHAVVFVVEDPQAFRQREGSPGGDQGLFIQGPYSGNLSSNGERLFLLAPDGSQIASQDVGADHAVINELQANSPSGGAGDWIELLNPTTWTVDLSGLWLSDSATTLGKWQIPAGTVLAPGQLVTFTQNQDFGSAFGLDKNGESVVLSDGGTIIDEQDFKASPLGATLGRYQTSDGKWDFPRLASPTFNAPNSTPLVGPVVINEIMYHPLDGNDEFVELFNITNQPVSLFDAASPTHTWTVSGGTTYTFPTGQTIPAGGLAILTSAVVTDPTVMTAFRAKYSIPSAVQVYGPYLGHLNNSGDKVTLNQPGPYDSGTGTYPLYQVDHVQYEPVWPWPSAADGTGKDLERINPFVYGNDPANWSALDNGSPGQGGLIAGDANADGKVSFADYLILEANFGKSGMNWGTADFNGDGLVGFADYLILEANFGKKLVASAPAPAPLSEQTTIQTMAAAAVVQTSSSVTTSSNTIVLTQPSTVRLPASVHSINRSLSRLSLEDALNLLAI